MKTVSRLSLAAGVAALAAAGCAAPALARDPGCAGPLAGAAAESVAPEVLVTLPADAVVVLHGHASPAAAFVVAPAPGLRLIAQMQDQMQTMMRQMTAQMDALFAAPSWSPSPQAMIRAAFGPHPWAGFGPGSGVMVTQVSSGGHHCAESVTYSVPAGGGAPVVHVVRSGDACGSIRLVGPGLTPAASVPAPRAPALRPQPVAPGPRLIRASYRGPVPAAPHS